MSTDLGGGSEENRNEENQVENIDALDELAELIGEELGITPPPEWRPRKRAMAQLDATTSRSTQKKLYEQLSGKLHSDIGAIEEALAQKKFGDPLPEPLKAPVKSFNENREAAALAVSTEDHLAANGALKKVGEAIEAIKPALEGVPAFELLRQTITRIDSELVSEGYTTHPAQEMLGPRFDNYRQVKLTAEQLLTGVPDKAAAERKLEDLNEAKQRFPKAMVAIKRLADKVDAAYKNVEDAHKATLAKVELYEDLVEWQEYLRMKSDVDGLVDAFRNSYTIVNQSAALNACTDTYPPGRAKLDGPAGAKLAAMLEHAKPADLRRQLSELCSAGLSDSVAGIGKALGGKELLEKAMKQIGSKAETPEDKKLAAALIQGRYGPKIEGEFSAKNLPLLFNVLGKVPESHLRTGLKAIATSEFDDDYTAGDYSQTTKSIRIGKSQSGDDFKSTTLHEVGHAVDDAAGLMKTGGPPNFGGWNKESPESVAAALYKQHAKQLEDTLLWSPPKSEQGVIRMVAPPSATNIKAFFAEVLKGNSPTLADDPMGELQPILERHPAVAACKFVRQTNKFWDKGDSAANKYKMDGRVYFEAYAGDWWSYEHGQRKTSFVRNYGFRSPAEWFAEAYDSYYRGKLSKSHPAYTWLDENKKSGGVKV